MAEVKGNRGHRHPGTVAYLEGPGEEGAAVLRAYEGGYTRYWLESGEVRSCDITEDELPLAGFRPVGGPLPALLGAVSAEFGPQLPKLAAELASGAPDLDSVERVLRDSSLGGGAMALRMLFEQPDEALPPPDCASCGKPMCRRQARRKRAWLTRLGRVEVERSYYYCRSCGTNPAIRDALWFGLYTGMRRYEVLMLRWERVDMDALTFRVKETKTGVPLELPITNQLAAILERRRVAAGSPPRIYPKAFASGCSRRRQARPAMSRTRIISTPASARPAGPSSGYTACAIPSSPSPSAS